jgi:glycosyltransferase involved in cell wall biosynthesis
MASIPKNKFFKSIIEEIYNDSNITDDLPWITVGPVRLTNAYNSLNYIDLKIWPSHYFIPKHYDAPEYTGDEPVFSRHEWMTTMADYEYHQKRNKQKITKSKICVYGIALNEIKHVDRFMESAKDADLVVIADTGSTDGTAERLRELGAFVFDINIKPWRFDLARNSSLALIPKDIDICVSLDLDEILQPGWRAEIERLWTLNTTRIRYKFDCGNGVIFKKEWIHSRNGYMWRHMCHENIVPTGNIPEVYVDSNMILALHSPDDSKSRGQYLNMLRSSVKEDPTGPRSSFYYARELTFNSLWRESIEEFNRYLKLPNAYWTVERSYAMKCIGKAYNHLGDIYNAEKWLYLAAAELPNARESWCELALLFYYQSRWEECFALSMKTLKITSNVAEHTADTTVWGYLPHDLASIAAWHLGIKKVAIEQAKLAVNAAPDDTRLIDNLNALLDGQNDLD